MRVDAFCAGTLQPRQRLTQQAVAARLNVSRQPVTAALGVLKANHLAGSTGRRGVAAAAPGPDLSRRTSGRTRIRRAMSAILQSRTGYPEAVWHQHERLLAALVKGRTDIAVGVLREHLAGGFASLSHPALQQAAG